MRALLLHDETPIAPFDRPASECVLFTRSLVDELRRNLRNVGFRNIDTAALDADIVGPALCMVDNTWVTRRALAGFLHLAQKDPRPTVLALPASRLLELYAPLQDLERDDDKRARFDVFFVPAGRSTTLKALRALGPEHWLTTPYKEVGLPVRVPHHMMGQPEPYFNTPLTSTIALRVRHWVTALRAGMLYPQVALIEAMSKHPLHTLWTAARSLRSSKTRTMDAFRRNYRRVGKNSFIHNRAVVESCVIGNNVTVGPMAVLIGSIIGDNCVIEERAEVAYSVLGPSTYVSKSSVVLSCTTFGDTDACTNGIQTCIIAERCGLTSFAKVYDLLPAGAPVKTLDEGVLKSVGTLPCGAAFGEGVFIGAEARIAPGRSVPAGTTLLGPSDTMLRRPIAPEDVGVGRVADGRFVRASSSSSADHAT